MSVLDQMIEQLEQGVPVDPVRLARLQGAELAKLGEQFVEEQIQANREADERAVEFLRSLQ